MNQGAASVEQAAGQALKADGNGRYLWHTGLGLSPDLKLDFIVFFFEMTSFHPLVDINGVERGVKLRSHCFPKATQKFSHLSSAVHMLHKNLVRPSELLIEIQNRHLSVSHPFF